MALKYVSNPEKSIRLLKDLKKWSVHTMIILSIASLSASRSDVCLYGMEDKLEVTARRSEQDIS